jgi:hypothetical protein
MPDQKGNEMNKEMAVERVKEIRSNWKFCEAGESADLIDQLARELDTANARITELESVIKCIVEWLESNQPDVFSRGLWDAIPKVSKK